MPHYRRQPVLTSGFLAVAFDEGQSDCYVVTTDKLYRQMEKNNTEAFFSAADELLRLIPLTKSGEESWRLLAAIGMILSGPILQVNWLDTGMAFKPHLSRENCEKVRAELRLSLPREEDAATLGVGSAQLLSSTQVSS